MRKFEKVADDFIKYEAFNVKMPIRATKTSVGYDFYSPIDVSILPGETKLIFTNIKALFEDDEGLILASTSGLGRRGIILANGIGIIESDYYGNESNDGNLGFMLHNLGKDAVNINAGDKIGQGFFIKVLKVDDEALVETVRRGGFGSTDNQC